MKLWIISDLHLEVQNVPFPKSAPRGADAIVIAGDFCSIVDIRRWSKSIIDRYNLPILFVPGNHEYYNSGSGNRSIMRDRKLLRALHNESNDWRKGFYVLDNGGAIFPGVRIIGATLWTDMKLGLKDPEEMPWRLRDAESLIPDFRNIDLRYGTPFTPSEAMQLNQKSAEFLKWVIDEPFSGTTVIVTHHLPHPDCTPDIYDGHEGGFLYANSADVFEGVFNSENAPALWICGHAHQAIDVQVGKTRIVSNPYGYKATEAENMNGFRWDFLVDVG